MTLSAARGLLLLIEVMDSQKGYLVPVRDGPGALPCLTRWAELLGRRRRRRHLSSGNSGRHPGQETNCYIWSCSYGFGVLVRHI